VNNIDWEALTPDSAQYKMMTYYAGLIQLRQTYEIFRSNGSVAISFKSLSGGGMAVTFDDHKGGKALVLINPAAENDTYELTGSWQLLADGERAGSEVLATETGTVTVDARSVRIYVNG
jgi:pullulanase/glycogen debranching enzyme